MLGPRCALAAALCALSAHAEAGRAWIAHAEAGRVGSALGYVSLERRPRGVGGGVDRGGGIERGGYRSVERARSSKDDGAAAAASAAAGCAPRCAIGNAETVVAGAVTLRRRRRRAVAGAIAAGAVAVAMPASAACWRGLGQVESRVASCVVVSALARDAACSALAAVGAVLWLKLWSSLAAAGAVSPVVSRKLIHCGSAPLFLLVWPLYSTQPAARFVAAVVPALNAARLLAAGLGADSDLVAAVSRSGKKGEVLGGPLLYTGALLCATLLGWRTSPAAVVGLSQMAVGDGLADIVGRRFGSWNRLPKWLAPNKSVAGSCAFVVGAALASTALLKWFALFGFLSLRHLGAGALVARVVLISVLCALVELAPPSVADDNFSVPVVGAFLASRLL